MIDSTAIISTSPQPATTVVEPETAAFPLSTAPIPESPSNNKRTLIAAPSDLSAVIVRKEAAKKKPRPRVSTKYPLQWQQLEHATNRQSDFISRINLVFGNLTLNTVKACLEKAGVKKSAGFKTLNIDVFLATYKEHLSDEDLKKFRTLHENQSQLSGHDVELLKAIMKANVGLTAGDEVTSTFEDEKGSFTKVSAILDASGSVLTDRGLLNPNRWINQCAGSEDSKKNRFNTFHSLWAKGERLKVYQTRWFCSLFGVRYWESSIAEPNPESITSTSITTESFQDTKDDDDDDDEEKKAQKKRKRPRKSNEESLPAPPSTTLPEFPLPVIQTNPKRRGRPRKEEEQQHQLQQQQQQHQLGPLDLLSLPPKMEGNVSTQPTSEGDTLVLLEPDQTVSAQPTAASNRNEDDDDFVPEKMSKRKSTTPRAKKQKTSNTPSKDPLQTLVQASMTVHHVPTEHAHHHNETVEMSGSVSNYEHKAPSTFVADLTIPSVSVPTNALPNSAMPHPMMNLANVSMHHK